MDSRSKTTNESTTAASKSSPTWKTTRVLGWTASGACSAAGDRRPRGAARKCRRWERAGGVGYGSARAGLGARAGSQGVRRTDSGVQITSLSMAVVARSPRAQISRRRSSKSTGFPFELQIAQGRERLGHEIPGRSPPRDCGTGPRTSYRARGAVRGRGRSRGTPPEHLPLSGRGDSRGRRAGGPACAGSGRSRRCPRRCQWAATAEATTVLQRRPIKVKPSGLLRNLRQP